MSKDMDKLIFLGMSGLVNDVSLCFTSRQGIGIFSLQKQPSVTKVSQVKSRQEQVLLQ